MPEARANSQMRKAYEAARRRGRSERNSRAAIAVLSKACRAAGGEIGNAISKKKRQTPNPLSRMECLLRRRWGR